MRPLVVGRRGRRPRGVERRLACCRRALRLVERRGDLSLGAPHEGFAFLPPIGEREPPPPQPPLPPVLEGVVDAEAFADALRRLTAYMVSAGREIHRATSGWLAPRLEPAELRVRQRRLSMSAARVAATAAMVSAARPASTYLRA